MEDSGICGATATSARSAVFTTSTIPTLSQLEISEVTRSTSITRPHSYEYRREATEVRKRIFTRLTR